MDDVWAAVSAAVGTIIVGGVTPHLNLYLEPIRDFRTRMSAQKNDLLGRLAGRHAEVLRDLARATDEPLRSFVVAPKSAEPDKIDGYTSELFRVVGVFARLREFDRRIRAGHTILFATTCLGVAGVIASALAPGARPYVLIGGLCMLALQFASIWTVFRTARTLDDYEEVT
ncbi:MAG: hypothetical protein JNN27_07640 [Planctomycetes bacterium]|nr:hypothetical protein [Planctomycetota bacterium]